MIDESAPAKLNLVLQVGPRREDGLHEIASLFASLELADSIAVEPAPAAPDEVIAPGVEGPNLAEAAIAALRDALGGDLPPLRAAIEKRIPVAAGLGGGSADAAAVLRAGNRIAGNPLDAAALRSIGARIGADVPSQIEPGHALVTGAGENVERVELAALSVVLVPAGEGLSTAAVYAEADRVPTTRATLDPDAVRALAALSPPELAARLENDLEAAALSLRPELEETLAAVRGSGALAARVTGSGPTVFGLYADAAAAASAAERLPGAILTRLRE
ncbi:MAG: 4-diphosphocytidyl-2-C-methyl-D-erythritol kinase [Thermoleophilaceae bacterium]|jgi:4-diphosphocytidyl-2-C-methyl-D-erythritol kinase|nr:4-diphosphocytidyl-2-C-methyl-D-erythritol kinase [Thermoleophilaceae bacterium]